MVRRSRLPSKAMPRSGDLPSWPLISQRPITCYRLIKQISWQVTTAAKSLQSCSTLCDPIDGSPPGSPVPGILQARTLEWVAISFSSV